MRMEKIDAKIALSNVSLTSESWESFVFLFL